MKTVHLPLRRIHLQRNLRGYGLGGLFSRLGTFLKPLLRTAASAAKPIAKQTLKELGKQGLNVATSTLTDVIEGRAPVKEAMKRNVKQGAKKAKSTLQGGVKRALTQAHEDIKRQKQMGNGIKKPIAVGNSRNKRARNIFSP